MFRRRDRYPHLVAVLHLMETEGTQHEFVEGTADPKLCYHCGGYPFALQHWTI